MPDRQDRGVETHEIAWCRVDLVWPVLRAWNGWGNRRRDVTMLLASSFVIVALVLCVAAVLALFGVTYVSMSGAEAIERDGLAPGMGAPVWSLVDSAGKVVRSPPRTALQLIMFTDHSLKAFPSVVDGLREVMAQQRLTIVVLTRRGNELVEPVLRVLGLDDISVVTGSPSLYAAYNVRVTPFAIFVDSAGRVRASSLVNEAWQVTKLLQLADLPLEPDNLASRGRFRRRTAAAGV
jgi:hypothetical protein